MPEIEILRIHADRIRASGALGRSRLIEKLFDFLLDRTFSGKVPKEIEVALDAFGKDADFDVTQDATVRVYVHKLRRKLEEFYAGPGALETVRLSIPKGEYRFVGHAVESAMVPSAPAQVPPRERRPRSTWLFVLLVASALLNLILLRGATTPVAQAHDEFQEARHSRLWAPILNDDRAIIVVVGDYYIFGETDRSMEVTRLVREFNINSPQDLAEQMDLHPELADRYMDLQLGYLPTAAAYALRDIMPLLSVANRRVRVLTMSQLTPAVVKSAHIIYVGYLSGLGLLREPLFSNSRLSVGESYDEIVDRNTHKDYVSEAATPSKFDAMIHDYGVLATFAGPSGNRIVVIAGTRDEGTMHMAETATNADRLNSLFAPASATSAGFEALYEVNGMDRVNLNGKLLFTSPRDGVSFWTGSKEGISQAARVDDATKTH
jgi:hypothetical protein